ncbi:MAG: FAD-dependent monooxygenase [Acidobacteriota bacterium]
MIPQALILGGGPAGCAAAIELARAGRSVMLIEREAQPRHKVCGEFLSGESLALLQHLGVDPAQHGAVSIHSTRLASRRNLTTARLPFAALSLTRRTLDEALLFAAHSAGVDVRRGCSVESIRPLDAQNRWTATLDDGTTINAPAVFLATGKHDLRGHARPEGPQSNFIAFKMYFRLAPQQAAALANHVELLLYRGGYAGLQPVEDNAANLCCLIDRRTYQRIGGTWYSLLAHIEHRCPHLATRLRDAEPLLEKPLAIAHIPYGFLRRAAIAPNLWSLGDQAAVIPSFTGDGMSIALHTGLQAAHHFLTGATAEQFQQRLYSELHSQLTFATLLSRGLTRQPTRSLFTTIVRAAPRSLGLVATRTRIRNFQLAAPAPIADILSA